LNITVLKEPNIWFECMELLFRYTNHNDHRTLKETLTQKYNLEHDSLEAYLTGIIDLGEFIYNNLTIPKDRLDFFFSEQGEQWSYAHMLLMALLHQSANDTADELRHKITAQSQEDLLKQYAEFLTNSLSDKSTGEVMTSYIGEMELIRVIETLEIDSQQKWQLILLYQNYSLYMDELITILDQAVTLFRQGFPLIGPLLTTFYDTYSDLLQHDPVNYVHQHFRIRLSNNRDIVFAPYIFGCNAVVYYDSDTTPAEQIYIGVLFETLSSIGDQTISDERICKTLRILSDTSKYEILKSIRDKPAYGQELADQLNLSTATISHHMSTLINSGFIQLEKRTNRIYYQMDKEKVARFIDQLKTSLIPD
jgi:DNA-binding transcriptional ArsR family regulator